MKRKLFVMDVDGTLTDGRIYMGSQGEVMKAFDVKDGYGIKMLQKHGIVPVIITGRTSEIVAARAAELGIDQLYQGVPDKLTRLKEIAGCMYLEAKDIAYIGDDLNDLDCIRYAGLTAAPSDAMEQVKKEVDYVCRHAGGRGAVREFADRIMGEQD